MIYKKQKTRYTTKIPNGFKQKIAIIFIKEKKTMFKKDLFYANGTKNEVHRKICI